MIANIFNTKGYRSKDLYTLLVAFLLIFSASSKTIDTFLSVTKSGKEIVKTLNQNSKKSTVNLSIDDNDEDLEEVDLDDIEEFLSTSVQNNFYLSEIEVKSISISTLSFKKFLKKPLYILYCNWKFHLC